MKRSLSATLLATVILTLLVTPLAWSQEEAEAATEEAQALSPEILEAKTIFILNTVMDFSLASAFTTAIMDWERFEVVFSEEDADLCFALSAQDDYRKQEIPAASDTEDDDGMRRRTVGTMRTLDNLYLKVFVPGGDDLWRDEAEVGDDSQAAVDLVDRLRERIEEEETADTDEASSD